MQASIIIKGTGSIVTTGFRGLDGDFVLIEIANNNNSLSVQVPNEQIIRFYEAMVDALAPHVDEQRAAQLADEQLVDLIASGATLTIRGDAETEAS